MFKNLRLIYITTSDKKEAREIGCKLVEERLAACINIIDNMESIYWWEGKLEESNECVLIAKTHYSKVKKLTKRVVELHSYECPCVISLTITEDEGHAPYLDRIEQNTKAPFRAQ